MNAMAESFKGLGKVKLGLMTAVGIGLLGLFALVGLRVSSPAFSPLYTNLTLQDSAKIVSELEKQNVPYELRANGAEVLVPNDKVLRLRMGMAQAGLPSGGSIVGYEIFDKSETFGSSNFVMNVNAMRALEGELARTIGSFTQVDQARVHLVVPKRELFTRDRQEPSASVWVKLRGNQELSKSEIASITHFTSAAVPGLRTSRITVVDSNGRLLARGDGDDSSAAAASSAEEFRVNYENRIKQTLEDLIEKVVGPGRVKAEVAADMNFDRIVTKSEKYDPDGQVARSVQSNSTRDNSEEKEGKDAVTVANQLPNSAGTSNQNSPQNKRQSEKSDETTNYEISKTVQEHAKEGGTVNKISVAVLVDGNYSAPDADGNQTYTPRSDEELKRIQSLVKTAIGFDEKRGDTVEVVNMQFNQVKEEVVAESFFEKFRHQTEGIIQTLIIAVVLILAILLVLRPAIMHVVRNTTPASDKTADALAALEAPNPAMRLPGAGAGAFTPPSTGESEIQFEEDDTMVNLNNIKGRVRSSAIKKVNDMVEKNPDESVNVVRQWMLREA